MERRRFLQTLAAGAAGGLVSCARQVRAAAKVSHGTMAGDVLADRAMIWARADGPARMLVDWSTTESMADVRHVIGPDALESSAFMVKQDLRELPAGQTIFYRVQFLDLSDGKTLSEPVTGRFRTAPEGVRDVRFLWSGDTCGQGFGINPDRGGMRIYESMRLREPDFFIHSGDTIYADNPIPAEVKLPDGSVWKNVTTEAKGKVAETLDEYRGAHLYNFLDENVRRFHSEVPQVWQWDDHEVMNNWSPGKDLIRDAKYTEKSILKLAAQARRAFLEVAPIRYNDVEVQRIYRKIPYGPLLDVFVVDMRSYRAANNYNRQPSESAETVYMGKPQLEWLRRGLKESRAVWKVIAADMPLGLMVGDGKDAEGRPRFENSANGPGPAAGRELEIAWLLGGMKQDGVRNVVWLTADVHYTAAHYYDPAKAKFTEFDPFYEFVSGPLNAGSFRSPGLDDTFGIQVLYEKMPSAAQAGQGPALGMQFFGEVQIAGADSTMTVILRDMTGQELHRQVLTPAAAQQRVARI